MNFQRYGSNVKIYIIIFLATIFVAILGVNAYHSARVNLLELSNANKVTTANNMLSLFTLWIDERINTLKRASKFIEQTNSNDEIVKLLTHLLNNSPEFDTIQRLNTDRELWINNAWMPIDAKNYPREGLLWYVLTKDRLEPTVHFTPKHHVLKQETLNFCVPNFKNGKFVAVVCGIVKLQNIFEKIADFKLPSNFYSFIITKY
ncbi:cache domain-containing protein [Campylobacter suis]|uniref:Methyl-accepting chemotaxis protein n=1 Tax=Campylobacter suis TaxID=2790657 RepID=A0ABM8Q8T5_9BACT|nr:cache domain-containing protein [Campylobacter suis]CAD7289299.1 hypothetical protein LMG8286_01740 [Campylobacter suis]